MFAILATIGVVATAVGVGVDIESTQAALEEQEQSLKSQELDNKYKTLVRKNQTLDDMQTALQKNEAHMAVTGGRLNSPTDFAIQSNIIRTGDQALKNADAAESINDYSNELQEQDDRTNANLKSIQIATGGVSDIASIGSSYFGERSIRNRGNSL